ncbi:MAG TPA: archaeal proteasome endopeptidase complex subunit alpha [Candidatus Thermoplasmatota archaeon]|nr:archaeal proteasome endopeptidase complex subunit alpha [Candidatus Thermoplasmatota archaeon]
MQPAQMYDRAITVFSPDGRLFQVEYAREAVKRGTTTVGLKFQDGVVLIVDKRITSQLIEPGSIEKIFKLDDHVGCATSGLVADARVLVDRARTDAQMNRVTYDEYVEVETLVKKICDFKQTYTQYGGVRPFGTALLIAGRDATNVLLFETDPSGALMSYKATAIGAGRSQVMEIFEAEYREGLSKDDAIALGLKALYRATEGKLNASALEIGIVTRDADFRKLTAEEIRAYADRIPSGGA